MRALQAWMLGFSSGDGRNLTVCIRKRRWHYLGLHMCLLLMDLSCTVATGTSGGESWSYLMIMKAHLASLYWLLICHWHQDNKHGTESSRSFHICPKAAAVFWVLWSGKKELGRAADLCWLFWREVLPSFLLSLLPKNLISTVSPESQWRL